MKEYAEKRGVNRSTIHRWLKDKKRPIVTVKVGRYKRRWFLPLKIEEKILAAARPRVRLYTNTGTNLILQQDRSLSKGS